MNSEAELLERLSNLIKEQGVGRILISAYPGFGKTRLIPKIVDLVQNDVDKILIFTRSISEIEEICRFFIEFEKYRKINYTVSVLIGREKLCPFKASNIDICAQLRDRGICMLTRLKNLSTFREAECGTIDHRRIIELSRKISTCPYDLSLSIAIQSKVVILTVTYLSNMELYGIVQKILANSKTYAVVIDEAHTIVTGIELSMEYESRHIQKFVDDVLDDNDEVFVIRPRVNIDVLRQKMNFHSRDVLSALFTDLLYLKRMGNKVIIKTLTISSILDLIRKSRYAILLSASLTEKFKNISILLRDFHKIFIRDTPGYIDNLKVYIVHDVEFNEKFKYTRHSLGLIRKIINAVITNSPLIGGIMILFSSKKFLEYFLEKSRDFLDRINASIFVFNSDDSYDVIDNFKRTSREDRSILISYVGSSVCEGVNFLGDELVTIVVIGFPFPEFSSWNMNKMKFLGKYYCKGKGFLATFIFPAISSTIQIIGRAMRDLDKRIKRMFLVDRRFLRYLKYFPHWISKPHIVSVRELVESFDVLL